MMKHRPSRMPVFDWMSEDKEDMVRGYLDILYDGEGWKSSIHGTRKQLLALYRRFYIDLLPTMSPEELATIPTLERVPPIPKKIIPREKGPTPPTWAEVCRERELQMKHARYQMRIEDAMAFSTMQQVIALAKELAK